MELDDFANLKTNLEMRERKRRSIPHTFASHPSLPYRDATGDVLALAEYGGAHRPR